MTPDHTNFCLIEDNDFQCRELYNFGETFFAIQGQETVFIPDQYYAPDSPEMSLIARPQTLARWRCEGKGPAYLKAGGRRVLYRGADVLAWLGRSRVETEKAARAST